MGASIARRPLPGNSQSVPAMVVMTLLCERAGVRKTAVATKMSFDTIVAYKEEYPALYSVELFIEYGKRLNVFAGGQKSRFLMYQPYGMKAYYSTFSTFAPRIPKLFWNACEHGEAAAALDVVKRYDVSFFARFSFAFWRATLEHFGIAKRYMRPPDRSFTPAQTAELDAFYRGLNL